MAMDSTINGGSNTAGKANVDATYNLNVTTPKVLNQAGFVTLAGQNDFGLGSVVPGGRINQILVSEAGGIYSASKNLLWDDTFNATTQNTSKYKYAFTTMTAAQAAGFLTLNSGSITTLSTSCGYQTWKQFPLFAKAELRCNISAQVPNGAQANQTIEFGLFQATLNGAAPGAPTDGVFFRFNTSGELRGYINYNGTETSTGPMTVPSNSVNHDWLIVCQTDTVCYYIDDVLQAVLSLQTNAPTQGQPFQGASQPVTFRVYTAGSAPALAPILKVSDCFVAELGPDLARPWATQKAGFGHMGYQGQNGGTQGGTSNLSNAALAAATILSNTAVGTGNPAGLGGYSHDLCTLAAGTAGIITSYQNPVAAAGVTGRNLIIQGVWVHSVVDAAITGGPLAFVYSLAFGHTAVSLATAESGSFTTGTTKAPRQIALGCEGFAATAVAGTLLSPSGVYRQFVSPIVVAPGEFVAVVGRNFGTAVTVGSVVHTVGFDAYFE
jgi:hypothetical protein